MPDAKGITPVLWKLVVVGGEEQNTGKTKLVCAVIRAFPKVNWIAGKISDHASSVGSLTERRPVLHWETSSDTATETAQFLAAGAIRSFHLRTRQEFLADAILLLGHSLRKLELHLDHAKQTALVVDSNSLPQLVEPSLYFALVDPGTTDFTHSAHLNLDLANALVLPAPNAASDPDPDAPPASLWLNLPAKLLQLRPSVLLREGEPLPRPLESFIYQMLDDPPAVPL